MISFRHKGNFKKTEKLLKKSIGRDYRSVLEKYGQKGVEMLAANTPKDSGKTAESWSYALEERNGYLSVTWFNSNINKGVNIAIILQYGHGTGNGGYVEGRDYINPALQPIFDAMAEAAWKEVTSV